MMLADVVLAKKWELDALRDKLRPGALDEFDRSHHIDIVCTSNAIDGNTMTVEETTLILDKNATFTGKPLKDHFEVAELGKALEWALALAAQKHMTFNEMSLRSLHRQAVGQSNPEIAGRYADRPRRMETDRGVVDFPAPDGIATHISEFCTWLAAMAEEPVFAFDAHLRLMKIHPFNDGNGRAARLLMNLVLARAGYPIVAIRPEDRAAYRDTIATAVRGGGDAAFRELMFRRLDETLDTYLAAARRAPHETAEAASTEATSTRT